MWKFVAALSKGRVGSFTKVLQPQNKERLHFEPRSLSNLQLGVRSTNDYQTTSSNQGDWGKSFLEGLKLKKNVQQVEDGVVDLQMELRKVKYAIENKNQQVLSIQSEQEMLHKKMTDIVQEIKDNSSPHSNTKHVPQLHNTDVDWSSKNFPWSAELDKTLQDVFQIKHFHPVQLQAINSTMSKCDVLLIMSTGGGKSLCFQLPAIISKGITLVVTPLVSLMEDQVLNLKQYGIKAHMLKADSSMDDVMEVYDSMKSPNPQVKLVYVTPEKISKSKQFMSHLDKCYKSGNLSRIAIDEVHCVSQWGNDFRPDYKMLGILKRLYPSTPIIGLTATSTNKVTFDTKQLLNIPDCLVFRTPLVRKNLFYEVRPKPTTHQKVVQDIVTTIQENFKGESGIIYCISCRNCTDVCNSLIKSGIRAAVYHARCSAKKKSEVHQQWLNNEIQVICATVAFGMGINKPQVRFVIHHSISKSVENYFQEAGRAGRDGKPSLCLLYFGFWDVFRQTSMVFRERTGTENLSKVVKFCHNLKTCRVELLANHFGEVNEQCQSPGMCDVCSNLQKTTKKDVTEPCKVLLRLIKSNSMDGNRLTGIQLVDAAIRDSKNRKTKWKDLSRHEWQRIVFDMLVNGFLREDYHLTSRSTIVYLTYGRNVRFLLNNKVMLDLHDNIQQPKNIYKDCLSLNHGTLEKIPKLDNLGKSDNT
nr:ATP-dependent DNA helicase Q1-like isoform X1 [Ciona intestinalis]|eukprot:XP_026690193.1 ATP-dependent DNA helicase Q1-like isoform X1 [Ciona intestinalis]